MSRPARPLAPQPTLVALVVGAVLIVGAVLGVGVSPVAAAVPPGPGLAGPDVAVAAGAPPLPEVLAESWLVADLDTGQVLAAKSAHTRLAPASTLKTLTALTLLPRLDPAQVITPTAADVGVEGSKVGLVAGVDYPAEELFAALLMVSGNDAANALATAAGGQAVTARFMNDLARELGALDTRAVNPHGLDAEGQVSTAYDLAVIARAGLEDDDFARHVTTQSASVVAPAGSPRIETYNKNKLLRDYPGALGVKNGFTSRARASFVGAAERDGRRLVVTLLKADPRVFDQAAPLLDWGFAASAAGVDAVGALPQQEQPDEPGPVEQAAAALGVTAPPAGAEAPVPPPTGLPVTLAGLGLAGAALLVVRRRPAPTRPAVRRRR